MTLVLATLSIPAAQASSSGRHGTISIESRPDSSSGVVETHNPGGVTTRAAPGPSRHLQAATQRLRTGVQERRSAAFRHADWLGVQRHKAAYRERQAIGVRYLKWLRHRWSVRAHRLWKLRAHTLRDFPFAPGNSAWLRAIDEVQRVFPGTSGWLLSCSAAEGGHGRWVGYGGVGYSTFLRDTGTVGGPLQFRFGTFTWAWHRGREYALERGFRFGDHLRDDTTAWRSALGQAVAGGWARYTGNDDSHWAASFGRGC